MREFLNKPAGKIVALIVLVLCLGVAAYVFLSGSGSVANANSRMFVDTSTGKGFAHTLVSGESIPVAAPSGGKTGYPAELCYWTADGKPKSDPDYVALNAMRGVGGPTFCPVCHRLVVGHNPGAIEGNHAPPTETEFKSDPRNYSSLSSDDRR